MSCKHFFLSYTFLLFYPVLEASYLMIRTWTKRQKGHHCPRIASSLVSESLFFFNRPHLLFPGIPLVVLICRECSLTHRFSKDLIHELSLDLRSFLKLRLSEYNLCMNPSRTILDTNLNQLVRNSVDLVT